MKLEKIKLSQLKPSDYNPRTITPDEQKRLEKNLAEFGLVDPIIVNLKNNHIIGGHQRYNVISKKNKNAEYDMIRLGDIGWIFNNEKLSIKDSNHEKALNLALNKISGDWDYGKLTTVLNDLQSHQFNMDLTGFDDIELASFNIDDNIFLNDQIFEIEDEYTPPEPSHEPQSDTSQPMENAGGERYEPPTDSDSEVLVNESDVHKFKCPQCGYEW